MTPDPDYPAAHSMDTDWFAVDKDGHVAYFSSSEDGAVPQGAATTDSDSILDKVVETLPRSHRFFELASWIGEGDDVVECHVDITDGYVDWNIMFLDSIDPVRDLIDGREVLAFPTEVGVILYNRGFNEADRIRDLHRSGRCLGCFELEYGELAARLGLFAFEHQGASIAGPYELDQVPDQPIRADALPEPLRGLVQNVRFESLTFPETDRIQPIEHAECGTWGGFEYLSSDGVTIRALPGMEDEFRDENEEKWTKPAKRKAALPYRYEPPDD